MNRQQVNLSVVSTHFSPLSNCFRAPATGLLAASSPRKPKTNLRNSV
ncbi:Protein of unknown function [Pyronema omphalodes CBS 100304]|uniref:Uncharacterized protein n=1 Tax=Pyronema omphalodes (strain CBS 100304) TaxID=1076935 RepID=U4L4M8_PYROM|nr:Protein of unknown function [Pyronema omphalodes CBS 100304]